MTVNVLTTDSIKDLLAFPFRGKDWQNRFLIGIGILLLGFIPFLPWLLSFGYFGRVMQRAIQGEELELPAWEDWGKLLMDGLRLFGLNMIYLLPAYIVMFGGMAAYFFSFPLFVAFMDAAEQTPEAVTVAPLLVFVPMGIMFFSMFFGYLLLFLGGAPLPVAMARVVEQGRFASGFQFRHIHRLLWRNKGSYFVAWLILIGLFALYYILNMMFTMSVIFFWVSFVIGIPLGFYLMTLAAALFGQAYREGLALPD
jgi:hypothetical protein